jgi:hypothetical protein
LARVDRVSADACALKALQATRAWALGAALGAQGVLVAKYGTGTAAPMERSFWRELASSGRSVE